MSMDMFRTLESLRTYLLKDIAGAVPKDMVADVRAAAKMLGEISREADQLSSVLHREMRDWIALNTRALALLDQGNVADAVLSAQVKAVEHIEDPASSLVQLMSARNGLATAMGPLVQQLQKRAAQDIAACLLLDKYYAVFGRLSEQRTDWQSVFAVSAAVPTVATAQKHGGQDNGSG